MLCAIIAAINPNFLSFGNFVRISQTAAIPLVLGLGATFVILMGSIDLSVEGTLTCSAVILSMLVLNGANGNDLGLLGVLAVLVVGGGPISAARVAALLATGAIVRVHAPTLCEDLGDLYASDAIAYRGARPPTRPARGGRRRSRGACARASARGTTAG